MQKAKKPLHVVLLSPQAREVLIRISPWCAYASMGCSVLMILFTARSLWGLPLIGIFLPLNFVGRMSSRHRSAAETSWIIFLCFFSLSLPALFYGIQQADQSARMQQQQLIFINQSRILLNEQTVLKKQLTLLSQHLTTQQASASQETVDTWKTGVTQTQEMLKELNGSIESIHSFLVYNYSRYTQNSWILSSASRIDSNDTIIKSNDQEIAAINDWISRVYDPAITKNNQLLPVKEKIAYRHPQWQTTCQGVPLCAPPPWQQSFIQGWQRVVMQPLSSTWPFWSMLVLAVLGAFFVLPALWRVFWKACYRVLFVKPVSGPGELLGPVANMTSWPDTARIIKIVIWRPFTALQRLQSSREVYQDDAITFDFGPTATVLATSVETHIRQPRQSGQAGLTQPPPPEPEASIDPSAGAVVLKLGSSVPVRPLFSAYPIQLYVAADCDVSSLTASARLSGIQIFQCVRGPEFLSTVGDLLDLFLVAITYLLIYIGLAACSLRFFDGLDWDGLPFFLNPITWVIWGMVLGIVCKVGAFIIEKLTVQPQSLIASV